MVGSTAFGEQLQLQTAPAGERYIACCLDAVGERSDRVKRLLCVPELGQGRCLAVLGDAAADAPLREARELFASMGYNRALAETDALLGKSKTAAV